jgi:hypothetical protein
MDDELRQQFQALSALIKSVDLKTGALSTQIESVDRKTEVLSTLIEGVKESLEREIGTVRETVLRMATRLDKIAAGAHYVTRLVEWSESQDAFQLDILHRVQALESHQDKKQG